jgi:hypothetical protein
MEVNREDRYLSGRDARYFDQQGWLTIVLDQGFKGEPWSLSL